MSGIEAMTCLLCTLDAGTKQRSQGASNRAKHLYLDYSQGVDNGCDVVSLRISALCIIMALRTSIQAAAYHADCTRHWTKLDQVVPSLTIPRTPSGFRNIRVALCSKPMELSYP